jgi:hypothetical protein
MDSLLVAPDAADEWLCLRRDLHQAGALLSAESLHRHGHHRAQVLG